MTQTRILNIFIFFLLLGQISLGQIVYSSKITNMSIDANGLMKWTVFSPGGKLTQTIESFENENWKVIYSSTAIPIISISLGETKGLKTNQSTTLKLHWGKNKFRIKVMSPYTFTSEEIELYSTKPEIINTPPFEAKDYFSFDKKNSYQIFDKKSKQVLLGNDSIVNLSSLKRGTYYLQIDTVKRWTIIHKK
jgi:hypothetical protein